jgi:ketosteroid isomerase-like protein
MLKIVGVVLLAATCFSPAYGQARKTATSGAVAAVEQVERNWLNAEKTGNTGELNQILADDWVGLNYDGTTETKQGHLNDVKSGASKLDSYEIGPMDVKVAGGVAIVQGSDTEKSSFKGKDTSGKWVWMDVFVKRGGRWQAVRSQLARVP